MTEAKTTVRAVPSRPRRQPLLMIATEHGSDLVDRYGRAGVGPHRVHDGGDFVAEPVLEAVVAILESGEARAHDVVGGGERARRDAFVDVGRLILGQFERPARRTDHLEPPVADPGGASGMSGRPTRQDADRG